MLGSGFTGRLFGIVRDQEGLTYDINAYMDNDTYTDGDWHISASFAPELLDKGRGVDAARAQTLVARSGVTADELEARKADLSAPIRSVSPPPMDSPAFMLRTCSEAGH